MTVLKPCEYVVNETKSSGYEKQEYYDFHYLNNSQELLFVMNKT